MALTTKISGQPSPIQKDLEHVSNSITDGALTTLISGIAGIALQVKAKIDIPGGSLHTIDRTRFARQGETFEQIAAQEYGNPILGDILRRVQPDKADLKTGDEVLLIDPDEINTVDVTPQSIALKNTPENNALREEFFDLRKRTTKIFV